VKGEKGKEEGIALTRKLFNISPDKFLSNTV
jgi:hypothetical protein